MSLIRTFSRVMYRYYGFIDGLRGDHRTIEIMLDNELPDPYPRELHEAKCAVVYQHVYESYFGAGKSI